MSIETLLLLRKCLCAQQMTVGDPAFPDTARTVLAALAELDAAIQAASESPSRAEMP